MILSRLARSGTSGPLLAIGLVAALALPWMIYPPVALDIICWALFAAAVDLLLGFTGLLSFGHAAFWGGSAYCTGLIALHSGLPFPVAILGGAAFAALLALPIGYLSVRLTGIYFAMVTLAFAQMVYFIANQWPGRHLGGENGLGHPARAVRPRPVRAVLLLLRGAAVRAGRAVRRVADRPVAVRPGAGVDPRQPRPRPRARLPVDRYQLLAFVLSAGSPGWPGACSPSATGSPRSKASTGRPPGRP